MPMIDMILRVQPNIDGLPQGKDTAWKAATGSDEITVKSWKDQWINQTRSNMSFDFSANSAMNVYGKEFGKPVILMGAGPSLAKNWKELVGDGEKSRGRQNIRIVTSVHNFSFCEDRNLMTGDDYYMVLDAGDIVIREMSEGGTHDAEWYRQRTEGRTLVAYHGTHPEFIRMWRGPKLWYTTPFASDEIGVQMVNMIDFTQVPCFNVGGNVMGAALYFARVVLGCSVPIFVGMDLCFGYNQKFHAWDSQYDEKFAGVMPWTDIYGNRVWTWPSYFGFKNWFDFMACGGQGNNGQIWINATEGGILGAYPQGNIKQIIQLDLKSALHIFNMSTMLPEMLKKSKDGKLHLLF